MAQKKAHEVDGWLAKPGRNQSVILLYGPDRGLVSERAAAFVKAAGLAADDPFASMRIDAGELEATPGRLLDEARTVPMFSDSRLIWVRNGPGQKRFSDEVKALLDTDIPPGSIVLIEAGELRKGHALRAAVENSGSAMALPCYLDETRSIDRLIDDELNRAGLTISPEARAYLKSQLGGDRLATRGELEKLALYCMDKTAVEIADVTQLIGDVSGRTAENVVDAVLSGDGASFEHAFSQMLAAGTNSYLPLSSLMRQFQQIALLRQTMEEKGIGPGEAVNAARPPIFFTRKKLIEGALRRWHKNDALRALERLQGAVQATRRRPVLADAAARQAMLALLVEGARRAR